jgi:hypothetical protein
LKTQRSTVKRSTVKRSTERSTVSGPPLSRSAQELEPIKLGGESSGVEAFSDLSQEDSNFLICLGAILALEILGEDSEMYIVGHD